jgi:mRNA-degrading endonuclease toxin of MazEF toxin-antitoxin module
VVSENLRNRIRDHLIVVPMYSRGQLGPTRVPLLAPSGGVPHDSVLFCDELATIDRDYLAEGPLGKPVPPEVLREVIRAIRRALGEVLPA